METSLGPGGCEQLFPATGVAFVVALAGTWLTLAITRRLHVFDRPNRRSSHHSPTPTLGGVGIIAGTWAGFALILPLQPLHNATDILLLPLAASTAVLSLSVLDDLKRALKVWEKLALQVAAAAIVTGAGLRLNNLALPWLGQVELSPSVDVILTVTWIVFFTNVFNFMDGIDGITVSQSASAGVWLAIVLFTLGSPLWLVPAIVAAAALGFGVFNFPPARIFMGDVGSLFLGFVFAVMSIAGQAAGLPLWLFAAIFGYYLFDSIYTLVRRLGSGQNILEAHRSHLYQLLVQSRGWSHGQVDVAVLLTNLLLGAAVYAALGTSTLLSSLLFAAVAVMFVAAASWLGGRGAKPE